MSRSSVHASIDFRLPPARSEEGAVVSEEALLSVVIPLYNEQDNVTSTYEDLRAVLSRLGHPFEILFVDDGSSDQTPARLLGIVKADPKVRVITLARNFGQTAAIMAGLDHASGEVVAIMDGDG